MLDDLFRVVGAIGGLATPTPTLYAFPAAARHVLLAVPGGYPVFYKLGNSSVVASLVDSDCLLPGTKELFDAGGATHISVLTEANTSRFTAANGFGET